MKIAIVHDYIKEYGGAERVLEALHEIWPNAPVFTSVYLPEFLGPHRERFNPSAGSGWNIKTSWLQFLPFKSKMISPIRLVAPFVFKQFNFSQFDVVIVSATGAYVSNSIVCHPERSEGSRDSSAKPQNDTRDPIHICYCHTPPRYLYGYATAREWKNNLISRILGEIANHFLRLIDFKSSQNVDFFIANSKNVAGRIKKFYRKESVVIYPPVDVARSQPHVSDDARQHNLRFLSESASLSKSRLQTDRQPTFNSSESGLSPRSYFLAGGRLARPKNIGLIIKTFVKLDLPLKVFGRTFAEHDSLFMTPRSAKASQGEHNSNIEFVGEVSDEEKMELMAQAKAFIFAAEDEDFGITPVEAMSVGTPVIAYASGGVLETVIDGKTGILYRFNDLSAIPMLSGRQVQAGLNHLSEAIRKFEKTKFDRELIIEHAAKFSKERFKKEILEFVSEKLKK